MANTANSASAANQAATANGPTAANSVTILEQGRVGGIGDIGRGAGKPAAGGGGGGGGGYDLDASYSIDTIPLIHWDASTLESENSASDGSTFSTWTSREGNDYDLNQADAAEQFTYEATSSNMNSKPVVVSSDGARHMMTATDFLSAGTVTQPVTLIFAIHKETLGSLKALFSGKDTSGSGLWHFTDYSPRSIFGSPQWYIYDGGYVGGSTTDMVTGAQIITWELNPAGTTNFYKELARSTTVSGTPSANNPFNYLFSLGSATNGGYDVPTDTEIGEVIIFNEVLSDTTVTSDNVDGGELFTIISYLKNKYGIS